VRDDECQWESTYIGSVQWSQFLVIPCSKHNIFDDRAVRQFSLFLSHSSFSKCQHLRKTVVARILPTDRRQQTKLLQFNYFCYSLVLIAQRKTSVLATSDTLSNLRNHLRSLRRSAIQRALNPSCAEEMSIRLDVVGLDLDITNFVDFGLDPGCTFCTMLHNFRTRTGFGLS